MHKTLKHVFNKIVILTIFASPKEKHDLDTAGKNITIVVVKIVVKVIHEEDKDHKVKKIIVIKEEDEADKPTVTNIFSS